METLNDFYTKKFQTSWFQYRSYKYKKSFDKAYDRYIATELGHFELDKLSRREVLLWFRKRSATAPIEMNKVLSYLSVLLSCARDDFELIPHNPCQGIKKNPGNQRERYASPLEFKLLLEVMKRYEADFPKHVAVIKLLMLTGARPTEIINMKWKDIRIKNDVYVLESQTGKKGKTTLIFPPEATAILNSFPLGTATVCDMKLTTVRDVWYKIRKDAGCEDLWMRDLRRTFATQKFSKGMDIGMVGELLNHKSLSSTKVYAKLMLDARINAVKDSAEPLFEVQNPLSPSQSKVP